LQIFFAKIRTVQLEFLTLEQQNESVKVCSIWMPSKNWIIQRTPYFRKCHRFWIWDRQIKSGFVQYLQKYKIQNEARKRSSVVASVRITVLTEWFLGFRAVLTQPVRRHSVTNCWIVRFATYLCLLLLKPWRGHFFLQHSVNCFFEAWWRNVQKWKEVKNGDWIVVKWSEVKWSFLMECVLSLIYSYVAVCRLCSCM